MATYDWHDGATIYLRSGAGAETHERQESAGHTLASAVAAAMGTYGEQIENVVIRMDQGGDYVGREIMEIARDPNRPGVA
ncbi:hypothetical protein ACFOMD_00845 [Sphingoaurantiacus capsulatus]|uniref:Transposase n=1 Tax=Sphingoaurantiacus capsulatus TaxID=1771310 RepID=A0ABV7X554_9SPHN